MTRNFLRTVALWASVLLAGCDQFGLGPDQAAPGPPQIAPAPPAAIADLRPVVGERYPVFASGIGARYSPEKLGLNAIDRARLWRGMASPAAAQLVQGGGAEALVFRGCADPSCSDGVAVVAIDTATGAVFVGVRDQTGVEALVPNDRVEALLRLSSSTRNWDDSASALASGEPSP